VTCASSTFRLARSARRPSRSAQSAGPVRAATAAPYAIKVGRRGARSISNAWSCVGRFVLTPGLPRPLAAALAARRRVRSDGQLVAPRADLGRRVRARPRGWVAAAAIVGGFRARAARAPSSSARTLPRRQKKCSSARTHACKGGVERGPPPRAPETRAGHAPPEPSRVPGATRLPLVPRRLPLASQRADLDHLVTPDGCAKVPILCSRPPGRVSFEGRARGPLGNGPTGPP